MNTLKSIFLFMIYSLFLPFAIQEKKEYIFFFFTNKEIQQHNFPFPNFQLIYITVNFILRTNIKTIEF